MEPEKAWREKTARLRQRLMERGGCLLSLEELRNWLDEQREIGEGGKRLPLFRCTYCRSLVSECDITVDHDRPVSRGGTATRVNLKPACELCNRRKGEMSGAVYAMLLKFVQLNMTPQDQTYLWSKLSQRPARRPYAPRVRVIGGRR